MNTIKLYDDIIRSHNTHPYHFEKTADCKHAVEANNFICGDKFDLCLTMDRDAITNIQFHGFGCAVSKASTSILARELEGKSKTEAVQICDQFLRLLRNEVGGEEQLFCEDFRSFQVVHEIPARYDCAARAWEEVQRILSN